MWQEVEAKWKAFQEATKTKAVRQKVEQVSNIVKLMQTEGNALDKMMEEINILNCSINAIVKQADNNGGKAVEANERVRQGVKDGSIPSVVVNSGTT